MSQHLTATDTPAQEGVALSEKHYPPNGSHEARKRKDTVSGPTRTSPRKKILDRKAPYPTSRFERARAPSPPARSYWPKSTSDHIPDIADWPTDFCMFMDCDITVPHGHTKKEIKERIGYSSWFEDMFQPSWAQADDSVEYDGLYHGRPSDMGGSSLLNSNTKGADDLREALPPIIKGSSILHPGGDGTKDLREALPKMEAIVQEMQSGGIPNTKIPQRSDSLPKKGPDNASSAATPQTSARQN